MKASSWASFFVPRSLNDLSSSQAACPCATLLATAELYCITQPGNTHLLLLGVVGGRNHVELERSILRELSTLCDGAGEINIMQSICKALASQVRNQPRLYHCMPTRFDRI